MAFVGKESAYRNRRKSRNPTQIPGIKRIPRSSARRAGDSDEFHGYGQSAQSHLLPWFRRRGRANTIMSGNQRLSLWERTASRPSEVIR